MLLGHYEFTAGGVEGEFYLQEADDSQETRNDCFTIMQLLLLEKEQNTLHQSTAMSTPGNACIPCVSKVPFSLSVWTRFRQIPFMLSSNRTSIRLP